MNENMKHMGLPVQDELTFELARSITPIKGEEVYTQITLREPNLSQLSEFIKKAQKETAVDAMRYLIGLVSEIPITALNKMTVRDFYKCQDYLITFITPPAEDDPEGNVEGSPSDGS